MAPSVPWTKGHTMRLPLSPALIHNTLTWRMLIVRWERKFGDRRNPACATKGQP